MKQTRRCGLVAGLTILLCAGSAQALTVPFTEGFDTTNQAWLDAANAPLTHVANGGATGGYVTTTTTLINDPGTITFRASGLTNSSSGEFFGDWIAGNVSVLSAFVRHDAPAPLNFFFRITTGFNFPAHVGIVPVPVLPNQWTQVQLVIDESNPLLVAEGGTFLGNFSDVTNVQLGASVPLAFEGMPITLDLDTVSVVPEPSTALLLGLGLVGFGVQRRQRRRT